MDPILAQVILERCHYDEYLSYTATHRRWFRVLGGERFDVAVGIAEFDSCVRFANGDEFTGKEAKDLMRLGATIAHTNYRILDA